MWTFARRIISPTFQTENVGRIANLSSSTSLIRFALFHAQPQAICPLISTWIPIHTAASISVFQLGMPIIRPDTAHKPVLVLFWLTTLLVFALSNARQCLICSATAMFAPSLVPFKHPCSLHKTIREPVCLLVPIIALLIITRADVLQPAQRRNMALLMESRLYVWTSVRLRHTETSKQRRVGRFARMALLLITELGFVFHIVQLVPLLTLTSTFVLSFATIPSLSLLTLPPINV